MGKRLRLGFIGGGLNSAVGNTHRIAAQMDGCWELAAGAFSRHAEVNQATGKAWNVEPPRIYDDWRCMLDAERGRLEAVVVLTPTGSHAPMVIEALRAGYPVICEKALAGSSEEAAVIERELRKTGGFLAVTYNYTGYPMLRQLRQMVGDGRFGEIRQVQIEMPQEGFVRVDDQGRPMIPQKWRLADGAVPTVSLDLGVHLHQMVRFLTGQRPLSVLAVEDTFGHFENVVDNVMCIARYSGEMTCQVWYGKSALGHRNGLKVRIYGQRGSAQWLQMKPEELHVADASGNASVLDRASLPMLAAEDRYNRFKAGHPAGFIEAFANHYVDLADAVGEFTRTGRTANPWVFSIDHAMEGLRMLEAMTASARDEAWVRLDDVSPNRKLTPVITRLSA